MNLCEAARKYPSKIRLPHWSESQWIRLAPNNESYIEPGGGKYDFRWNDLTRDDWEEYREPESKFFFRDHLTGKNLTRVNPHTGEMFEEPEKIEYYYQNPSTGEISKVGTDGEKKIIDILLNMNECLMAIHKEVKKGEK